MSRLAQLIKLRDYISRYEMNPFHYPTQFIRLKRENWDKLINMWELENEEQWRVEKAEKEKAEHEGFRWNPFFQKKIKVEDPIIFKRNLPESKDLLRKYFLNQLYPFQLKWATSTLTQVSYTDKKYYYDEQLKFFLQHFPDIYLVMYYPIFNIKKAPIDTDIIIISPLEIEIISLIHEEPNTTVIIDDERTWTVDYNETTKKIISPVISLKRTEQIINSILKKYDLTFHIRKTVLSENARFLYTTEPYNVQLIDKKDFENWYKEKRSLSISLKAAQLKVMGALLEHTLSMSVRRPEWESDDDEKVSIIVEE